MADDKKVKVSAEFRRDFEYLALHRNFQILGAFAWLTKIKDKRGYGAYLPPALDMLKERLAHSEFDPYSNIRKLVQNLKIPESMK